MTDFESAIHTTVQLNSALAGRYVVEEEIGRGGMATVYRAVDVRHNRHVAIKVLRHDIGAALGPERFLSEIQLTANLQHPNLLPLFDSGEVVVAGRSESGGDGPRSLLFYVMPYVEGQTLRQRLQREGQLPVQEALRITAGIAGALDYAHRHGVVHRDLKPENILLHEQQPLVMDFGIALALAAAGGERLTQMGISLGTPQYMSPEQATGDRDLDARSDVYSLAVVLYEMLSGAPPHTGASVQAVIAKVIMDRPASVRSTRALVPEYVDAALGCALAKLPADRYSSASDFAKALTGDHALVPRELTSGEVQSRAPRIPALAAVERLLATPVARRVVGGSALLVLFGAAAAAGAVGALAWFAAPERPAAKFVVALSDSAALSNSPRAVAISPDGTQLALATTSGQGARLLSRPMAAVVSSRVFGTDSARAPAFSPDGRWLLFAVGDRLMKVSSEGGSPLQLADSANGQHSWGEGDRIVFIRAGDVWMVPSGGGSQHLVARADSAAGIRALGWPDVLPGGRDALITIERTTGTAPDSNHLGIVSLEDGGVRDLGLVGTGARFAPPGHVVYATADGSLWAVPFSPRALSVDGNRVLLASGVRVDRRGGVDVAASASGVLVYVDRPGVGTGGDRRLALAIIDRTGAARQVSGQSGGFYSPRVSPDGGRIALTVSDATNRTDVWIYEIATGQLTPMTRDGTSEFPEWFDARRVAYRWNPYHRSGSYMVQPWDHSAEATQLLVPSAIGGTSLVYGLSLGPRSGYLALMRTPGGPNSIAKLQDIHVAPMERPNEQQEFVATMASEVSPRVSPNGRWLAYSSNESGVFQIYVLPLPGPGPRVPISIEHGIEPIWSRDGHTLYYVSRTRLLAARVDESSGFRATRQDTLFDFREKAFATFPPNLLRALNGFYDVFPNGDFVVLKRLPDDSARPSVVALLRWQQLVKGGIAQGARP